MIRHKINDINTTLLRFAKKSKNRIKHRNLSEQLAKNYYNPIALTNYNKSRLTGPEPCVCHAPSRSLYFDIHGKATACCFNRVHVLGKYPENSVSEIIKSDKRKFLQKELCRQNFMYGCQHCHKLIEAGNFEGVEARQYDTLKEQDFIPSEITFELDNTCNLECVMCHEEFSSSIAKSKGVANIKHPYDKEFLNQLKEYIPYLKVAKFLGGEPFLINIYYEIWDLILELNPNCKINLQTNGTIFNDKIKDYLQRGNFNIGVSIDSLKAETFASIRRNAKLDTVLNNLDKFISISKPKNNYVNISVCPMQQNWQEIPDLVNLCNQKRVFVYFNHVYTEGFAISELPEDKLLEIIDYFKSSKLSNTGIISKRNNKFFNNLVSQIEAWHHEKEIKSLPYKKQHPYSSEKLKLALSEKLKDNTDAQLKLKDAFSTINQDFLVSDNDIETIKSIQSSDLVQAANNETIEQLQERIISFIETGSFGNSTK